MTLLLPFANGADRSEAFLDHALIVASVPLVLVALVVLSCAGVQRVAGAIPLRRTVPNPTAHTTRGRGPFRRRCRRPGKAER